MNTQNSVRTLSVFLLFTAVAFAEPEVRKEVVIRRSAGQDDGPRFNMKMERQGPGQIETEKVAYLGVETMPVDPTMAAQLALPRGTGVVIRRVADGSPAESLLQPHDILTKLDDQILVNMSQLSVLVRNHAVGDEVQLTYIRGGKIATLKAKLGEREVPKFAWDGAEGGPAMRFFGDNPAQGGRAMALPPGLDHDDVMRVIGGERMNWFAQPRVHVLRRQGSAGTTILDLPAGSFVFSDDEGSIEVNATGGKRELTVKDNAGKVTYQGPINTPEEQAKIPAEVRSRIDEIGEGDFGAGKDGIKVETKILQPGAKVRFGFPPPRPESKSEAGLRDL